MDYTSGKFDKPFAIESVGFGVLLSFDMWEKHIEVTDDFIFYMSTDDIAFQFLYHNFHNVVLPDLYIMNRQELKEKYNISVNSTQSAAEGNDFHFGIGNNGRM